MGRLLFVVRARAPALFMLAGAGACALLGGWFALGYDTVPGPAAAALRYGPALVLGFSTLGLSRLGLRLWNQRTEFYERGFAHLARSSRIEARYAELRSLACSAVDNVQAQGRTTILVLTTKSGETVRAVHQAAIGAPDPNLEAMSRVASAELASAWRQQLQVRRSIDWLLDKKAQPLARITRTGVELRANAEAAFEPVSAANLQYELAAGELTLFSERRPVLKLEAGSPNVYPGLVLVARLDREQDKGEAP
ncbi:MAG TPA: hypothetical protein VIJ10_12485 [Vicinamibacteria bacterium]|jgi:hypothetical protein